MQDKRNNSDTTKINQHCLIHEIFFLSTSLVLAKILNTNTTITGTTATRANLLNIKRQNKAKNTIHNKGILLIANNIKNTTGNNDISNCTSCILTRSRKDKINTSIIIINIGSNSNNLKFKFHFKDGSRTSE